MAPGARSHNLDLKKSTMKRSKRSINIPIGMLSNLPSTSTNRFSVLANQHDMDLDTVSNINEAKIVKPPPLVVDAKINLSDLQTLLGKDPVYKRTSIGTKVFPPNIESYEKCKSILLGKKFEFHTFNSKENRLYTMFLYGLPKLKIEDIKKDIEEYNLTPSSITEVNTKFSSVNNAVYKVQFARKNFSPKSLSNVSSLCNIMVTWKKYKPRKNDNPTQCWNCLMYGHGGEHCNRLPACMICANQHHTKVCPLQNQEKMPAVFSCFNCKKNGKERTDHSANDINCPFRSLYLETRSKATRKNSRNHNNRQSSPQYFNNDVHTTNLNNNSNHNTLSYANCVRGNNDLFNIDELFNIFTTALSDLQKCTTKIQQIQIVMSMVKYAYGLH